MTTSIKAVRQAFAARLLDSWYSGRSQLTAIHPLLRLGATGYARGLARDQKRRSARQVRLPVPVVSVGNITVGGTGKTPVTLWLAEHLAGKGMGVAILSRGYGRRESAPARVPPLRVDALHFGDEPVLMAQRGGNVWVGRDRIGAGRAALAESGAEGLILDDGFQLLELARDLDLVLLDAHNPFGNGSLLPLGPLREPIAHLARADAFLLTRAEDAARSAVSRAFLESHFPGRPIFSCRHRIAGFRFGADGPMHPPESIHRCPVLAFAGIAHPQGFFEALSRLGLEVRHTLPFPDHHPYAATDLTEILRCKAQTGAELLLTTEKDLVRLPLSLQPVVLAAALEIDFLDQARSFEDFLAAKLSSNR